MVAVVVVMRMTRLMRFDSGVAVAICAAIVYEEVGTWVGTYVDGYLWRTCQ